MGATLEALLELRSVQLQITDIRRQLAAKERLVARQEAKVRELEGQLHQQQAELKQTQVLADSADLDLKGHDEHVSKLRDNLNTVRTNKEYAAVLTELNNEKADRSRVEQRALELLNEVDQRRKGVNERTATLTEEKRRLENVRTQLAQVQQSFADRLGSLTAQRTAAADKLDPRVLDMFDRLSERYDGEAMAQCVQVHPRRQEYICEGCNMELTVERANALLTRDDVVTCGSCGRILFLTPKAGR